ncbi:hypothetical protein [Cytobacillus praedii]|uniref:hypothetical protein n=1 Tax=Cytobacillus praedii TaxID=1742358 RepID=UPI003AF6FB5A
MGIYIVLMALMIGILIIFRRKVALRKKIRKIIKKHPNTINYLKKGLFKRHELIKSLKGKIIDELSNSKISIDKNKLDRMIEIEIERELKGRKGTLSTFIGITGSILAFGFIVFILTSHETTITSGGENNNLTKEERLLQEKDNGKEGKKEVKTDKNEENYNKGFTYLNEGQAKKAIKQFKMVDENSNKYKDAQEQIRTIERSLYIEESKEINYKELKKRPEEFKGNIIHLYGEIYNIQEVNGKTILALSTTQNNNDVNIGEEALILFPKPTPLNEGDYIHIYGSMMGNYSNNYEAISNYLKKDQYTIYFDQRTFIEQVPVIKTKVIVDINGNMFE